MQMLIHGALQMSKRPNTDKLQTSLHFKTLERKGKNTYTVWSGWVERQCCVSIQTAGIKDVIGSNVCRVQRELCSEHYILCSVLSAIRGLAGLQWQDQHHGPYGISIISGVQISATRQHVVRRLHDPVLAWLLRLSVTQQHHRDTGLSKGVCLIPGNHTQNGHYTLIMPPKARSRLRAELLNRSLAESHGGEK